MQLYQTLFLKFREMYYASITIGIIASSCIGSIAAMLILMNGYGIWQMLQLFLVVAVAMAYNATVLAQLRPKFIFNALLISLSTSMMVITGYLLF
ncbi:hypothetical protein [Sinomicrobium weinanense]|uniref:Uncharacterized protein n=1 Tax=Sinomicrobium weinanense TaxID=2842200 RepID=A0A926JVU6_9FLAO|nr:hypothetical protein [Sinomicrobium weinanense]MBC9798304.1 hypothetical protein [Sinomicrobium weinanense]MBU3121769.1 hypothetical protein [Sinomicrobium weinanense]